MIGLEGEQLGDMTSDEARRLAEEAGFDLVVPRSRMAREMPELVAKLLGKPR